MRTREGFFFSKTLPFFKCTRRRFLSLSADPFFSFVVASCRSGATAESAFSLPDGGTGGTDNFFFLVGGVSLVTFDPLQFEDACLSEAV